MLKIVILFIKSLFFFDIYFYLNEIKKKIMEENRSVEIDEVLPKILSINLNDKKYKKIKFRIENFIKNHNVDIKISYDKENIKFFSYKEQIEEKTKNNIIVKILIICRDLFGFYVFFFIFSIFFLMIFNPILNTFLENFLNKEHVDIFSYSISLALMLLLLNNTNYSFSLKIPIFFVMAIYAILMIFSSFIKYKIIGSYFPKIDFDPAIWIISCYLYIVIFYSLPIFSFIIYSSFLKVSEIKILFNADKSLVIESMGYAILQFFGNLQSRLIFNFFGFKEFEAPKNNKIGSIQKLKIKFSICFMLLNIGILSYDQDLLMKSYIYSHSSFNNSFCQNLKNDVIIVKDLNRAFEITENSDSKYTLHRIECN